jgi:hypothetical protein
MSKSGQAGGRDAGVALAAGWNAVLRDKPLANGEAEWRAKIDELWQSGKPAWRKRFPGFERRARAD